MKASIRVTAEPQGYSVWLLDDTPSVLVTWTRQGQAHQCAAILARAGGCGKGRLCKECPHLIKEN